MGAVPRLPSRWGVKRTELLALGADPVWQLWEPVARAVGCRLWMASSWTAVRTARVSAVLVSPWEVSAPHCVRLARVWVDRQLPGVDLWLVCATAGPDLCSQVLRAGGAGCLAHLPACAAVRRVIALAAWESTSGR